MIDSQLTIISRTFKAATCATLVWFGLSQGSIAATDTKSLTPILSLLLFRYSMDACAEPRFTVDSTAEDWHNSSLQTSLYFGPFDKLEERILAQLQTAETSIHMALFNLRLASVKDMLIAKHNSGVDVHVLLDAKQQALAQNTMGAELTSAGVPVTNITNSSADSASMHNRFIVVDGSYVLSASADLSQPSLNSNDEDLVVLKSANLASRYETEFLELVAGTEVGSPAYASGIKLRAWMGPEDNLYQKVVDAIDAAQSQILVAMYQLDSSNIVTALLNANDRGINVIVLLDQEQANLDGETADETLAAAGVSVILAAMIDSAVMHSKFLVVDHDKVLMGSFNWTNLGSFFNDENLLEIDDSLLASRAEGKIAQLIDTYSSATALELGLTTGKQVVNFSVSNLVLDTGDTLKIKSLNGGPFDTATNLLNFSLDTSLAAGTSFQYHYEIHGPSGVHIESRVRTMTVPYAPGKFAVTDVFCGR